MKAKKKYIIANMHLHSIVNSDETMTVVVVVVVVVDMLMFKSKFPSFSDNLSSLSFYPFLSIKFAKKIISKINSLSLHFSSFNATALRKKEQCKKLDYLTKS